MKVLTSYWEGAGRCTASRYFSIARLQTEGRASNMHRHPCHELYYSVRGEGTVQIEDKIYRTEPGSLFLISGQEKHGILGPDLSGPHESFVLFIDPAYLESISTPWTDLTLCFTQRPEGLSHCLSLSQGERRRFSYYFNKLSAESGFGRDVEERSAFAELMVFITKLAADGASGGEPAGQRQYFNSKVADIIAYIHCNIDSRLSIEEISAQFYLSTSYLCRLFKKYTGTTINSYITAHRIERARALLSGGYSVNEVCGMCGFNDYSNFFKAFTKKVGVSPKKYAQNSLS
ncbi:AraC family transcriptional regulator [Lachnospiraceae bacterium 54-53]